MRKAIWVGAGVVIIGGAFLASMVGLGFADTAENPSDTTPAPPGAIGTGDAATVVECLRGHGLAVAEAPTEVDPNAYVVALGGSDEEVADAQALVEDCEDRFDAPPTPPEPVELSDDQISAAQKEVLECLEEGGVEATHEMMLDPATQSEIMISASIAGVGHCVGMVEGPTFDVGELHFE